MRAFESDIFSAILRRRPTTLISSTVSLGAGAAGRCGLAAPAEGRRRDPRGVMRPAGPVPLTCRRSMPASRARSRTAGEASGFPASAPRCAAVQPAARVRLRRLSAPAAAGGDFTSGVADPCGLLLRLGLCRLRPTASVLAAGDRQPDQRRPDGDRVADLGAEPDDLAVDRRGISTVALSVITAASTASSRTRSPTLTCHSTSSASATPSPTSGQLDDVLGHPQASIAVAQRSADAGRPREIIPFLRVRIGRVPAGHARDRRFQMIEAVLLHQRREFGAEARGQRRLVHDDAAAGLLHRGDDRVRSSGRRVRRSMISASMPVSAAAASATCTMVP